MLQNRLSSRFRSSLQLVELDTSIWSPRCSVTLCLATATRTTHILCKTSRQPLLFLQSSEAHKLPAVLVFQYQDPCNMLAAARRLSRTVVGVDGSAAAAWQQALHLGSADFSSKAGGSRGSRGRSRGKVSCFAACSQWSHGCRVIVPQQPGRRVVVLARSTTASD